MTWRLLIALLLLPLSGCASDRPNLPYPTWYIGLGAPRHMEVWVESVDVVDRRNLAFERVHGGVVAYNNRTEGWWEGGGKMKPINNVDLPNLIFVRWQSLVEPQVYKLRITIPQWVRDEMVKPQRTVCVHSTQEVIRFRHDISIGLAPGGIVKVWVGGPCLKGEEIGRFVGVVERKGPSQGQTEGRFYRAPSEAARAYIEQHGIPYDSW
ncbi:hypothetical protein WP8S17C03_26940 [Metapseudomonas otitidis]|uniref:DUF2931 family protein n=1 Tax=Metapseudomonas otitidis TaxID=319939 RepID=A0A679GMH1_9GAMM|nr:DUF2931 family protein [Pseudomonas otitidis]BBT16645.1 hypothetical protein WP8S17C03_26940 [Pseudomonas otitidis]BCA28739.1 hypothetical protein PtoMrB4_27160 [Pseudomonas otitidis]